MRRKLPTLNLSADMDGMRTDYAAMKASKFRRTRTNLGGSADAHYQNETKFIEMREYARDMDRNDAIVSQMIDRAVVNVVQKGFVLDPQTGDKELDTALWYNFDEWANDRAACDVTGERTFWQMERATLRAQYIDGDVFANPLDNGQIELIEAHRCRTPSNTTQRVVHGIKLGPASQRLEYWFTKNPSDPFTRVEKVADIQRFPAFDDDGFRAMFQVYDPRRISQTRGVTALAPVFDVLGMIEDVNFAKLVQQQLVSCFAMFLEKEGDFQFGSRDTENQDDGTTATLESITPGMIVRGRKGEKASAISSNIPNPEFFTHMKLLLTLVGLNVGLPLVMVLMDGSQTNFSGWRGAVDQARLGFETIQKALAIQFQSEVYRWRVRRAIVTDAAIRSAAKRSGIRIFNHYWQPPGWRYIQPKDDVEADRSRLESLLSSPRRVLAEQGADHDDIVKETVEDNANAIAAAVEAAKAITEKTGEKISWKDLLFLSSVSKQKQPPPPAQAQPQAEETEVKP